jgi:hypothetical protein
MRLRRPALSLLLLTGLFLALLSPAQAADPTPGDQHPSAPSPVLRRALGRHLANDLAGSQTDVPAAAQDELSEAQQAFDPKADEPAAEPGVPVVASGGDATMPLRDLAVANGPTGRAPAGSSVAAYQRPWNDNNTAYSRACTPTTARTHVCVHWLSKDNPAYRNNPNASTNAYAALALATLVHVSETYVRAGYRQPKPDGPRPDHQPMYGGSSDTDVYLSDIGGSGLYGYCTVDRNDDGTFTYGYQIAHTRRSDLPAFCVLDNDMAEFPRTPQQDLEVTAAHEYFHAVQFAYDFLEDRWFMEASATWAEDQVYTSINDNLQYLRVSPLTRPRTALDRSVAPAQYGDWIFLRYVTERVPTSVGGMPYLMRRIWEFADSRGPDYYSTQAITAALHDRGVRDFPRLFGEFEAANRHPASAYEEGRANRYPTARPARRVRLSRSHRSASGSPAVAHLAAATIRVTPRHVHRGRLALSVDLPNKRAGSRAAVTVFYRSGRVSTRLVRLGRRGGGRLTVRSFTTRNISAVDLTLANANTHYTRCWTNTVYSCSGQPTRAAEERYRLTLK